MKNKTFKVLALTVTTAVTTMIVATTAVAQFARPDAAVKYRKASFTVMGTHSARIAAVVKGEVPFNKEDVVRNAALVHAMASLPWQAFGTGTEGGDALPAIWSEAAKFKSAQERLLVATANMNTAANSGELDAVKKAFANVGAACKNCHDDFKKK